MQSNGYERQHLFVGGQWISAATGWLSEVISPCTEEVIGCVPVASEPDIDAAAAAANEARKGPWADMTFTQRTEIILRVADYLETHIDGIAPVLSADMGTPIRNATQKLVPAAAQMTRAAVKCAEHVPLRHIRRDPAGAVLVVEEPVGIVAALVPFNGPLTIAVLKTIPALLAGCPVILKPSELAPLGAFFLADALLAAGLPAGMFNLVTGPPGLGSALVKHPAVNMISFTGSTAVGRVIAAEAGRDLKKVSLELGGKSAAILLDDADVNAAARVIGSAFGTAGQYCRALTRVLAPRNRYDEVVHALAQIAGSMTPGDVTDTATTLPPLISATQLGRVEGFVELAKSEGARLVCGGHRPSQPEKGFFYTPTVFADATNDMRFVREEIFGPVLAVLPYDDIADAIAIANDSPYGLSGAVFTTDESRGLEVALRVETGTTGINVHGARSCAPCGGIKSSGIGQEHGPEGFEEFLSPKSISISDELAARLEASGMPTTFELA